MKMKNQWSAYLVAREMKSLAENAEHAGWATHIPNPVGVRIDPRIKGLLDISWQTHDIIDYGRADLANHEEPWSPLILAKKMREAAERIEKLTEPNSIQDRVTGFDKHR